MNLSVKIAVASVLDKTGIISLVKSYRSTRGGLVLSLHRVLSAAEAEACFEPRITITDGVFEQFLDLLQEEFQVVSLKHLLHRPAETEGRQRVAITFDDGWADTYTNAYPLLLRYGLPATVFLCPGLMAEGQMLPEERFARIWRWCSKRQQIGMLLQDLRKWGFTGGESLARKVWSRSLRRLTIHAKLLMLNHLEATYLVPDCEKRRFLTWDEVKIMRRSNITFGSHTMHHSALTAEPDSSLEEELVASREAIESRLQEEATYLAYPNGVYNQHVMDAARAAGYTHCFATQRGIVRRDADNCSIPRIHINDSVLVNRISALHPSRVRFHLQRFAGVALAIAAFTFHHCVSVFQ